MNLLVRSSSISWHCSRSLKSGLSRKESLNSSVGRPIALPPVDASNPTVAMTELGRGELKLNIYYYSRYYDYRVGVNAVGESWKGPSSPPVLVPFSLFLP